MMIFLVRFLLADLIIFYLFLEVLSCVGPTFQLSWKVRQFCFLALRKLAVQHVSQ